MAKAYNLNKFYSKIFRRYDLINKLFTFGLDRKWRRVTIESCINQNPQKALDVCTGTGDLAIALSKASDNNLEVTGYDMNAEMLSQARIKADKLLSKNTTFVQGDAADMPFSDNYFDAITIGFGFRNLTFSNPQEEKHVTELFRVLKPGRHMYILESAVPENWLVRLIYKIHLYCFLIPLGGLLSGDFKAYWYLAHSSSKYYSSVQLKALLEKFGFKNVTFKRFLLGAANLVIAQK